MSGNLEIYSKAIEDANDCCFKQTACLIIELWSVRWTGSSTIMTTVD